jgi:hypothetical protein
MPFKIVVMVTNLLIYFLSRIFYTACLNGGWLPGGHIEMSSILADQWRPRL